MTVTMHWVEPALLWGNTIEQTPPRLLQYEEDTFLPDFLAQMQLAASATHHVKAHLMQLAPPESPPTLYHPLHQRYYLVTASLICKVNGYPDKVVDRKRDERTYFVMRRVVGTVEQGWSGQGGWQPLVDSAGAPLALLPDEEQFPLHMIPAQTGLKLSNYDCPQRNIYYGYIATGSREKRVPPHPLVADKSKSSGQILKDLQDAAQSPDFDPRLNEYDSRVQDRWMLLDNPVKNQLNPEQVTDILRNGVVDLGDFIGRALPNVWRALKEPGDNPALPPAQKALFQYLNLNQFHRPDPEDPMRADSLRSALLGFRSFIEAGTASGQMPFPTPAEAPLRVDLLTILKQQMIGNLSVVVKTPADVSAYLEELRTKVNSALDEYSQPMKAALGPKAAQIEKDRLKLMRHMIRDEKVDGSGAPLDEGVYFLRLVYDRGPDCEPILSERSQAFKLARAVDPNAPARLVRIQAPSIRLQDLRKYAHGVGIQMSGDLNKVMNRVGPNLLKGDGLDTGGTGIAMVCTFSLQILFIIALVLVFVFAIVLNIVFWWLAFLRICLPIPKSN